MPDEGTKRSMGLAVQQTQIRNRTLHQTCCVDSGSIAGWNESSAALPAKPDHRCYGTVFPARCGLPFLTVRADRKAPLQAEQRESVAKTVDSHAPTTLSADALHDGGAGGALRRPRRLRVAHNSCFVARRQTFASHARVRRGQNWANGHMAQRNPLMPRRARVMPEDGAGNGLSSHPGHRFPKPAR